MTVAPTPPTRSAHPARPSRRGLLACLIALPFAVIALPFALSLSPVVLDPLVFHLTGGCVPAFFTSDACRGTQSYSVDNQGGEPVDIVIVGPAGEYVALHDVERFYPVENYVIEGRCDPDLVVIARASSDGHEIARKVGMCRREVWQFGGAGPAVPPM